MLARRDTRREASRLRPLSPLQTLEDQSRTWGIRCHSCTGREGFAPSWKLSYKTYVLRFTRESKFSFNQRIAQTKPIENPSHDAGCGTDGLLLKAFGNLLGGQIRPHNVLAHGITCGAVLDRLLHLVGQVRVFDFRLFASTSRLADATSGRIIGELLEFPHAVFDGLGIASQDLGDVAGAAMAEFDRFECRKASAILFR